jgi:hypothetical protein
MLKDIILVQPYLSAYYETTKLIVDTRGLQYQNKETEWNDDYDDNYDGDINNSNAKF